MHVQRHIYIYIQFHNICITRDINNFTLLKPSKAICFVVSKRVSTFGRTERSDSSFSFFYSFFVSRRVCERFSVIFPRKVIPLFLPLAVQLNFRLKAGNFDVLKASFPNTNHAKLPFLLRLSLPHNFLLFTSYPRFLDFSWNFLYGKSF